jgi:uncharacterized protein (DUF58 family)
MAPRQPTILPDEVRDRIARLAITAQTMVEGPISGQHKSPFHGFSVEFAQHREYTFGDELKHVDWKVYGRSDRFYIKQYEEETNLNGFMLVDVSESMVYQGSKASMTKYEYAATLAAGLAFILLRQQDASGLLLFDEEVRKKLPGSAHPAQLRNMVKAMSEVEVLGESKEPALVFHRLADELKRRGLVFVISDLFFPTEDFLQGLRHLRHRRHEVVVLHILDRDELTFPFEDNTRFVGLERMPSLLSDPRALREAYLEEFGEFLGVVQGGCQNANVDYVQVDTSLPPGVMLARYLNQRQRRRRRA